MGRIERGIVVGVIALMLAAGGNANPSTDHQMLPMVQPDEITPFVRRAYGASKAARSRSCVNGAEFIVTLADDANTDEVVAMMNRDLKSNEANACRTLRVSGEAKPLADAGPPQLNAMTVCIPADIDVESKLQDILKIEGVQAVEENELMERQAAAAWHLDRIDQVRLPLNGRYIPEGAGKGVNVYVADTGTDAAHSDFGGRVTQGYSAVNGEKATSDRGKHGTHCAGIVGSRTYGVAKSATIIPVKVFSDRGGGATNADIIEAINWVISHKQTYAGSAVLSMSLGSASNGFHAGEQVLLRAMQSGIITIVAAGNSAADACGFWPAHSPSVISVGATDSKDYRSSFSNYGSCVWIYAPGSKIQSTLPGGSFGPMSGTSMACPVVSGSAALYLETHPNAKFQEVKQALFQNSVGQKQVAPAQRMVLVNIHFSKLAGLQEDTRLEVQASSLVQSGRSDWLQYGGFVGFGCFAGLAVLAAVSKYSATPDVVPDPEGSDMVCALTAE